MKTQSLSLKRRVQRGFTLIELAVVVGIIGVLVMVLAPSLAGTKDSATAKLLTKTAQNISNNWMLIAQACGTTSDSSSSPVILTGKTMGDVVFGGRANVTASYQTCYDQAHVLPLADVGQLQGTTWSVSNFNVSFSGGGTVPLKTTYAAVPDSLALMVAQQYTPSLAALVATGDSTSAVIQYGAPTSGARDVSVLRVVN